MPTPTPAALAPPASWCPTVPLRLRLLDPRVQPPAYATEHAAGMDVRAFLPSGSVKLAPGQIVRVPAGFALALPPGHEAQVRPRSGLATKHGITVPNAPGTIDADYRGEVQVALINLGSESFTVQDGMRIAQLVIAPVLRGVIEVAETLDATARGAGGFGSTGV